MNIKTEIKDYLRSPDNCGALLLTGQWGSGKSYLVGEIIRELAKEDSYAFAMISLFGIDNVALLLSVFAIFTWKRLPFCWEKQQEKPIKRFIKLLLQVQTLHLPLCLPLLAQQQQQQ